MESYICQKDVDLLCGGHEAGVGEREWEFLSLNSGFYATLGLYQGFGARLTDNGDLPLE